MGPQLQPLRKHPTAAAKYSLVAILYSHNLIGNPLLWNSAQLLWNMPTPNSLMGITMLIPPGGGNSSNCPPSSHFSRELPGVGAESSTSLLPGPGGALPIGPRVQFTNCATWNKLTFQNLHLCVTYILICMHTRTHTHTYIYILHYMYTIRKYNTHYIRVRECVCVCPKWVCVCVWARFDRTRKSDLEQPKPNLKSDLWIMVLLMAMRQKIDR